jgi:hypothetical protein
MKIHVLKNDLKQKRYTTRPIPTMHHWPTSAAAVLRESLPVWALAQPRNTECVYMSIVPKKDSIALYFSVVDKDFWDVDIDKVA